MPALRTLLALLVVASVAAADELRTLDNRTIAGKVVAVNDKAVVIEKSDGGEETVPLENVIALDLQNIKGLPAGAKYIDIRLADDSLLHCSEFALKGKEVEITLGGNEKFKVPLANVVYIMKDAQNDKLKTAFDKMLGDKVKRDRLVVFKADQANALEGVLGGPDATGEKIEFRPADSNAFFVSLAKIHGLIFYRPDTAAGNHPVCMVYDVAGNALAAKKVAVKGTKIVIETTHQGTPVEWEQAAVARFDYNMGKLAFLSDMVPVKVVEKSAVGLIVTYRKDVNLDGDPIVLDRQYPKGLSLHAYTELEYDLKGRYKKFTAVLGVDTRVGTESEATVAFLVDGRAVFTQAVTAKMVVPVSLDITKAHSLRIIVSSNNILDLHDHVTIAMPKVTQ